MSERKNAVIYKHTFLTNSHRPRERWHLQFYCSPTEDYASSHVTFMCACCDAPANTVNSCNQKEYEGLYLLAVIEHHGLSNVVDGQRQSCPPGDDNGEDSRPNGQQGNDDEEGGGDGANDVRPDSRAVHYAHEGG